MMMFQIGTIAICMLAACQIDAFVPHQQQRFALPTTNNRREDTMKTALKAGLKPKPPASDPRQPRPPSTKPPMDMLLNDDDEDSSSSSKSGGGGGVPFFLAQQQQSAADDDTAEQPNNSLSLELEEELQWIDFPISSLRDELRSRGLATAGTKEELAARLDDDDYLQDKPALRKIRAGSRVLQNWVEGMPQEIEKGVPPEAIKGAAVTAAVLGAVVGKGVTAAGAAGVGAALVAITPGETGEAVRRIGTFCWSAANGLSDILKKVDPDNELLKYPVEAVAKGIQYAVKSQDEYFTEVEEKAQARKALEDQVKIEEEKLLAEKEERTARSLLETRIEIEANEKATQAAEEEARLAEAARLAEEARLADEAWLAEEAQLIEEARLLEEARLAEEAENARLAEAEAEKARLEEEAEKARLAEEEAERARLAEEEAEKARLAEEAKKARLAEEEAEKARLAEEIEKTRLAEEEEEKALLAEEAEALRLVEEAEKLRVAQEERLMEDSRLGRESIAAEEARLSEQDDKDDVELDVWAESIRAAQESIDGNIAGLDDAIAGLDDALDDWEAAEKLAGDLSKPQEMEPEEEEDMEALAQAARDAVASFEKVQQEEEQQKLEQRDEWASQMEEPPAVVPETTNWSAMKVVDLRQELKSRGLSTSGKKADLVARLEEADSDLVGAIDVVGVADEIDSELDVSPDAELDNAFAGADGDVDMEELARAAREAVEAFEGPGPLEDVDDDDDDEPWDAIDDDLDFDDESIDFEELGAMARAAAEEFSSEIEESPEDREWSKLTVAQLRQELKERGLPQKGKKAELVALLESSSSSSSGEEDDVDDDVDDDAFDIPVDLGDIQLPGGLDFDEEPSDEALWEIEESVQEAVVPDYSSMTVAELKKELKSRGLAVSGRKAELIARLEQ